MDERQEYYEGIARESLFRIRALYPLMGEKASLSPGRKPWGIESFRSNKKEFLCFVKGTGKTLEYYGTSEEELQCLEARIETIHWLQQARLSQKNGPYKIGKGQEKKIIELALKSVGSNLEEIAKFKNLS